MVHCDCDGTKSGYPQVHRERREASHFYVSFIHPIPDMFYLIALCDQCSTHNCFSNMDLASKKWRKITEDEWKWYDSIIEIHRK